MVFKKLKFWFDKDLAILLSSKINLLKPDFNSVEFINEVELEVENLELKDRVEVIADKIHKYLGENYSKNIETLSGILGPENNEETGMFSNYYWLMPVAKYVEKYGIDSFQISFKMMKEITKRNTSEYTIRPFIEKYPEKTISVLMEWSNDKNSHVRRLTSEGVRPRLPWASKLQMFIDDPGPILPILSNLKDDSSKYVQKSVANCINDILKDNPDTGKKLIEEWVRGATPQRKWIIRHAVRNLLKKDDAWALGILT